MVDFPEKDVPILATGDLVVFPDAVLALVIQKERNLESLRHAQEGQGWILALAQRDGNVAPVEKDTLYRSGVLCRIEDSKPVKNGMRVLLKGIARFGVTDIEEKNGYLSASGARLIDRQDADEATIKSLRETLQAVIVEILGLLPADAHKLTDEVKKMENLTDLANFAAQYMNLPRKEAQEILEINSLKNRLLKLLEFLVAQKENLKVQSKIKETLSESMSRRQREAFLREQLKAIQDELGEDSDQPSADEYREKIESSGMPEEAKTVALREAKRLERMGDQSPESHVLRNYLDLLCEMPWNKLSEGKIDLDYAEKILNRDHYGLKKIKRRILEHLAVMKLQPEKRGSILLFVGPPGVGKTSLGKSIAEALGRQFVRVSLGGVRDDADVRGHRRTYVGALPGRIIDGIRRAKSKDPIFVLDEIDKISRGWGGDPSSALLEVLDPEQNSTFHDHYLDVPFDLSQVLFIATANSRDTIPAPLLDRMEIIELTGYTTDEKFHIAKDHLFPDELKDHGLKVGQVELPDELLLKTIESYTREAGVRSLRRELSKIARAAAARVAKSPDEQVIIDEALLIEILGPVRFEMEELETGATKAGVVTGMAWTPVGGDILFVEAAIIPGEGKVAITGQLGDVMKESSQIAVALARSRLEGVAKNVLFKDRDIHLHVPGGAIPKDGPSAGVTMLTAVASIMLGVPVDPKLAMTGEITLRGKILPVGGIKEKVLAAARSGVKEVILPAKNAKDLDELPEEVRHSLEFHLVSETEEILQLIFGNVLSSHETHEQSAGSKSVGVKCRPFRGGTNYRPGCHSKQVS